MRKLVWGYIKRQRRRTAFTVLGIVLACALVSSLGIFISSLQGMMLDMTAVDVGTYDFMVRSNSSAEDGLTLSEIETMCNHHLVQRGGVVVDGEEFHYSTSSGDKRIARLGQRDQASLSMKEYKLLQGRLPKDETEVMIAEALLSYFSVGDNITGSISRHIMDPFTSESETKELGTAAMTVVGVFEMSYGNSMITGGLLPGLDHSGAYQMYGQFKPGVNKAEALEKLKKDFPIKDSGAWLDLNISYLMWTGQSGTNEVQAAIFGTFLLLSAIILFAMGTVIRNSFAMSVAERTAQFGTLRCVGASPKQIRQLVFGEAVFVWLIGLPLGLLLGLAAMVLTFQAVSNIDFSGRSYFKLVAAAWPFVSTALLSLFAVLLCAWSPAHRASRVPAVEAVRGNAIFRENNAVKVRSGTLMARLFGLPGRLASRNIRRNKKRFRSTVFSVALSVTLFLCLSGFFQTAISGIFRYTDLDGIDFMLYPTALFSAPQSDTLDQIEQQLRDEGKTSRIARITNHDLATWDVPLEHRDAEFLKSDYYTSFQENAPNNVPNLSAYLMSIGREEYDQLELDAGAASYDELVREKKVLLHQRMVLASASTGMKTFSMANYRPGDDIRIRFHVTDKPPEDNGFKSDSSQRKELDRSLTIGGILSNTPWFVRQSQTSSALILIPEETALELLLPGGLYFPYNPGPELLVKAAPGCEEELSDFLDNIEKISEDVGLANIYAAEKEDRNQALVASIFVYGFLAMIVLICCVNLFNTVSANLQSRSRELAMMRAVGMDKRQFWKMLLLECVLYGVLGTLWGSAVGVALQAALLLALRDMIELSLFMPVQHILISFAVAIAVSLLAGVFPVRRLIRRPIVEEIRAQD